ncbi:hypothetical protein KJQ78_09140, partial [Campylobacter lari]|uniref:hypothetical protein n=1 Tax=Campylobacter lari TaxID=201 RepID=UPI001BD3931E
MRLLIKSFLIIACIAFLNYLYIEIVSPHSYPFYNHFFNFLDMALTWLFCFICVFGLFYIAKRIYYGKDKCKNFVFTSIIPIIILTIITKIFL